MYKNQKFQIFVGICALSAILVIGMQFQQTSFGQTNETSSSTEQTFASAFDTFVSSEPLGYGMYEEKESNIFAPGEPFLLYVEPVGYSYGNVTENGDQLYSMKFTTDFEILDPDGSVLAGQEDLPLSNLVSHHQNKEVMLQMTIDQTSPFPPGEYGIRYAFTDENSGKSFDLFKNVTVSANGVQSTTQQETSLESSKTTPDSAFLLISSDTTWSATVLDSGSDTSTQDGSQNSEIEFECLPGTMNSYSLSVQKQSEEGSLSLEVVQNGIVLDEGETTAAYGIVSLSGNCNEPG